VIRCSAILALVYALGIVAIGGWSLSHVLAGTVTRENFALVLVLPIAWIASFPGMAASLVLVWRIRGLARTVEGMAVRLKAGAPTAEHERELEDVLTTLAANENGLPERWLRPFVRRALRALIERARADAHGAGQA
jgi:hypothetical protein